MVRSFSSDLLTWKPSLASLPTLPPITVSGKPSASQRSTMITIVPKGSAAVELYAVGLCCALVDGLVNYSAMRPNGAKNWSTPKVFWVWMKWTSIIKNYRAFAEQRSN